MRAAVLLSVALVQPTECDLDKVVTMWHINPSRFGPVPRNMDTADVIGDLFFELFEVLNVPLACADPTVPDDKKPFECHNLEVVDPSDVVNQVTLKVDSHFSEYAMCNIGNKSGMDPLGRPCPIDDYCCFCAESSAVWPPNPAPCNATVGAANLYEHFQEQSARPCHKDYECWASHAAAKLDSAHPGFWYSPLEYGDCSMHPVGPNCTWQVQSVDKIVNATCHSNSFFGAVQRAAPTCFENCTGGGQAAPNASDPCWVRGFYEAVLGPDAGRAHDWSVSGLPIDDLIAYWRAPFQSEVEAEGGCPALPVPPLELDHKTRRAGHADEAKAKWSLSLRQQRRQAFRQRIARAAYA